MRCVVSTEPGQHATDGPSVLGWLAMSFGKGWSLKNYENNKPW